MAPSNASAGLIIVSEGGRGAWVPGTLFLSYHCAEQYLVVLGSGLAT